MKNRNPSYEINHTHAILNALRAALQGEESRLLSRELLGLSVDLPEVEKTSKAITYTEKLFSDFANEETVIICLDQAETYELQRLFSGQLTILPEQANHVETLISDLIKRSSNIEIILQELVSYFVGHTRARETYIEGLLRYAELFNIPEMADHWKRQLVFTQDIVDKAKELLAIVNNKIYSSNYIYHAVYDAVALIPASLRCQRHDMLRIKYLDSINFTYHQAEFLEEESKEWERVGLDAEAAGYWRAYGVSPKEFIEWIEAGFLEPRTAGSWRVRGFTPEEAENWAINGFDSAEADIYRLSGCEISKATSLRSTLQ